MHCGMVSGILGPYPVDFSSIATLQSQQPKMPPDIAKVSGEKRAKLPPEENQSLDQMPKHFFLLSRILFISVTFNRLSG